MRYRICTDDGIIGESDLPGVDFGMAVVSGHFVPTNGYQKAQHVFRMKTDASDAEGRNDDQEVLDAYRQAVARLNLRIENAAGATIPTGWIDIDDFSVELGEDDPDAFQISAHVSDLDALDAEHLEQARRAGRVAGAAAVSLRPGTVQSFGAQSKQLFAVDNAVAILAPASARGPGSLWLEPLTTRTVESTRTEHFEHLGDDVNRRRSATNMQHQSLVSTGSETRA